MPDEDERLEQQVRSAAHAERVAQRAAAVAVEGIAEMVARVDAMGPVGFLAKPLWPADAYGVIAAQDKAGKTWATIDLAVSVATGGKWFGRFDCKQGTVLMYCGEGGARNIVRRVRAVAEHKGIQMGLLDGKLRVSEQAPELRSDRAIDALHEELFLYKTALVIIDPLYLAAIGGRGSDLYAMGELLTDVQQVCQEAGAALLFSHHWNKTGTGTGANRMSGVGPGAWGRVLGSGAVEHTKRDGDKSVVDVRWEFTGSEIPGTAFSMRRTVWAEDPDDLASPLHYEVEVREGVASVAQAMDRYAEQRDTALAWLAEHPRSTTRTFEVVASRETRRALEDDGLIECLDGPRNAKLWSIKDSA